MDAPSPRRADDLLAAVELLAEGPDAELEAELDARRRRRSSRDFRRERTALLFSGEYDERNAILLDQRRRRRHRGDRLGRDAPAHVPALGRAPSLHDRDPRPAGRRAGRHQERDGRGRRAAGVRLAARRARRAPAGAHQPVRFAEPPPDDVRAGRGAAGGRRRRRDRARLGRDPRRHVPLAGRRRPARQQDRLGRPPHPPPDRHRRPEPERAQPDPEQGDGDQGPQGPAARARARGEGGRDPQRSRASTSRPAGATRSGATCCTRTRWSRTCAPTTRPATRRAVLDGDLDAFMQAELERGIGADGRRRDDRARRAPAGGRGPHVPPRPAPTSSTRAPRSGGSRSTTTSAASASPRSRPRPGRCVRLYAHLAATDPERFVVAVRAGGAPDEDERGRVRSASIVRERLWFLSMLFVAAGGPGARASAARCSRR